MLSAAVMLAVLAAGAARLRHREDLGLGPAVSKALSRSGGSSWLVDSTDYAPVPAPVRMAPLSVRSGLVHVSGAALFTHVAEFRHHIRPPPSA